MLIPLIPPRGNAAKLATYTGPLGSITVNTDAWTVHVHDGSTVGGFALSKVGHSHAANEVASWLGYTPAQLGSNGKLLDSQVPKIAITDTFVVTSQAAMLALTAETGDVAIRTDEGKSYILQGSDPTQLSGWINLPSPGGNGTVTSVNGQAGPTVTLTTADIGESGNLYFTNARSRSALSLTAGSSGITYNSTTGVLDCSGISAGLTTVNGVTGSGGSVTITTGVIAEGGSNLYFTNARARAAISLTAGSTGATYNSSTGVLDLSALTAAAGAAGSDRQLQYNNAGVLAGAANVTYLSDGTGLQVHTGDDTLNAGINFGRTANDINLFVVGSSYVGYQGYGAGEGVLNYRGTFHMAVLGGGPGGQAKPTFTHNDTGTTLSGVVTATSFAGSGASLTSLNASNLSSGTISGIRVNQRSGGVTSGTTITPPSDTVDYYSITSMPNNFTIANPSGTPVAGQKLLLFIGDNNTSRTITWGTAYRAFGTTLPTATNAGKPFYAGCVWNALSSVWDVIAIAQQA